MHHLCHLNNNNQLVFRNFQPVIERLKHSDSETDVALFAATYFESSDQIRCTNDHNVSSICIINIANISYKILPATEVWIDSEPMELILVLKNRLQIFISYTCSCHGYISSCMKSQHDLYCLATVILPSMQQYQADSNYSLS